MRKMDIVETQGGAWELLKNCCCAERIWFFFQCIRLAHSALKQHDDACKAYKRALELDPTNDSYTAYLEQAERDSTSVSD